ncbi:MAG: transposase [Rubrivivax sp.]|nr:transposase [Rubrivivax sp.]
MLSGGHRPSGPDGVTVERVLRNGKRVYVHGFKLAAVRRCMQPGISVAAVALEHGINANLLRKWIDKHRDEASSSNTVALLPVTTDAVDSAAPPAKMPESVAQNEASSCIEIELFGARVTLRGEVEPRQLRLVLDALARHR